MEGLIGIVGIALMVMEGVELFQHSSTRTIMVAIACCVVYMFYRWCKKIDFSAEKDKVEEPVKETKPEKKALAFTEYSNDYREEIYETKKEPNKGKKRTPVIDRDSYTANYDSTLRPIIGSNPYTNANEVMVSKTIQDAHKYAFTRLDEIRIADYSSKTQIMIHISFGDNVDLTIHGFRKPCFSLHSMQQYPAVMSAYARAGFPPLDKPYVYVGVSPHTTGSELPPDNKRCVFMAGDDLKGAVHYLIVNLISHYGEPPTYFFQIV